MKTYPDLKLSLVDCIGGCVPNHNKSNNFLHIALQCRNIKIQNYSFMEFEKKSLKSLVIKSLLRKFYSLNLFILISLSLTLYCQSEQYRHISNFLISGLGIIAPKTLNAICFWLLTDFALTRSRTLRKKKSIQFI